VERGANFSPEEEKTKNGRLGPPEEGRINRKSWCMEDALGKKLWTRCMSGERKRVLFANGHPPEKNCGEHGKKTQRKRT